MKASAKAGAEVAAKLGGRGGQRQLLGQDARRAFVLQRHLRGGRKHVDGGLGARAKLTADGSSTWSRTPSPVSARTTSSAMTLPEPSQIALTGASR